jgi:hypothetical protein
LAPAFEVAGFAAGFELLPGFAAALAALALDLAGAVLTGFALAAGFAFAVDLADFFALVVIGFPNPTRRPEEFPAGLVPSTTQKSTTHAGKRRRTALRYWGKGPPRQLPGSFLPRNYRGDHRSNRQGRRAADMLVGSRSVSRDFIFVRQTIIKRAQREGGPAKGMY